MALIVATLALGAGGGSAGTGSAGTGSAGTPTTRNTAPNGVEAKSANEILSAATQALRGAQSVHVVGKLADSGAGGVNLDVRLGRDSSQGSVTQKGGTLEIIATGGTLYLRGKQFFVRNAPANIANQVGDRWVRLPVSGLRQGLTFRDLVSLDSLAEGFLKPSGAISKGQGGIVNGTKAIAVMQNGHPLWVATTGPAYPLQIGQAAASGSTNSNSIAFRDYNAPLSVTAPADSIDFTQVTG